MSRDSGRSWRGAPSPGSLVGLLLLFTVSSGAGTLWWRVLPGLNGRGTLLAGWLAFLLLLVFAIVVTILEWGLLTLRYTIVDRAGDPAIVIGWLRSRVQIPLREIEYFGLARHVVRPVSTPWPLPWPGYYLTGLTDESLGHVRTFATLPLRRQLVICSSRGTYGISPDRPADLMAAIAAARRAETRRDDNVVATAELSRRRVTRRPLELAGSGEVELDDDEASAPSLLHDRLVVGLMLAGGALGTLMLWFIVIRFDSVPRALPLHYSATGQPDRIGTPREVFLLPLITALAAVGNVALASSVIRYDRFAARLLVGGTCLVQLVAWVALLRLF